MFTLDSVVLWGGHSMNIDACSRWPIRSERQAPGVRRWPGEFQRQGDAPGGRRSFRLTRSTITTPINCESRSTARARIAATSAEALDQTRQNATEFVWTVIRSVEELGEVRMGQHRPPRSW